MAVSKVFRVRVRHDCLHDILSWIFTDPSNKDILFLFLGDSIFSRSSVRLTWLYFECPSQLDYLLFKQRLHVHESDIDSES